MKNKYHAEVNRESLDVKVSSLSTCVEEFHCDRANFCIDGKGYQARFNPHYVRVFQISTKKINFSNIDATYRKDRDFNE